LRFVHKKKKIEILLWNCSLGRTKVYRSTKLSWIM